MSKYIKICFFCFAVISNGLCQDVADDIKIFLCPNSPKVYYEGQCIFFTDCIQNLSNEEKPYNRNVAIWFESLKSKEGANINQKMWGNGSLTNNNESKPLKPMPPHYKSIHDAYLNTWGNITFNDIMHIPNKSIGQAEVIPPHYFKPGEYELIIAANIGGQIIRTTYSFKVLPAEGKIKQEMLGYMNALKDDLRIDEEENPSKDKLEKEPALVTFLKNNINSIYATEVFRLITMGYDYKPNNVGNYLSKVRNFFFVFDNFPNIKHYQSDEVANYFFLLSSLNQDIRSFEQASLVPDLKVYLDSYLKKLVTYQPYVSDTLITIVKDRYGISDLKNYSREREETESQLKK